MGGQFPRTLNWSQIYSLLQNVTIKIRTGNRKRVPSTWNRKMKLSGNLTRGHDSSTFITHSLFCSHSSFSRFQCSVPVTRLSVKSLSDGHLWNGSWPGSWPGFYLGFMVWRSPEWPKASSFLGGSRVSSPGNFWKWVCPEMQSGAFWDTILRNVTVCAPTSSRLDNFSDIATYML